MSFTLALSPFSMAFALTLGFALQPLPEEVTYLRAAFTGLLVLQVQNIQPTCAAI